MSTTIHNVSVITNTEIIQNTNVLIENGIISAIDNGISTNSGTFIDGRGAMLIPGMIDLHVHGANGYDMMDGTTESIHHVSNALARAGCTAFLATSVTSSLEMLEKFIVSVKSLVGREPGAKIAGIHLEGPYLNAIRKGMQNEAHLRNPNIGEMEHLLDIAQGLVKMVTIAPELPGGMEMVDYLQKRGVVVAVAHSDATYEQAKLAFQHGASHVTHCFNAMRPIHHREPGIVVAAWEEEEVTCEAVVDNVHLHPATVRLMYRNLGHHRMALVTDAMQAMGMADGSYQFGGHTVTVCDGSARLESGALASSTLSMVRALATAVADGIPLYDAVQMASATPARIIGLQNYGSIKPGAIASCALLNPQFGIEWVMIEGQLICP